MPEKYLTEITRISSIVFFAHCVVKINSIKSRHVLYASIIGLPICSI